MTNISAETEQGNFEPVESYQDILDRDTRPVPEIFREVTHADAGCGPIPASRYTSADFFQLEVEKVWLKTWQFACLEDDLPDAGDTYVYDLVGRSAIVIRQADGSIRAFLNACRHRGRKLVTENGCRGMVRCPYHGLTWNTDGSFKVNPFKWDFLHVDDSDFGLFPVRCESWAGFVFINFDADAAPLLDLIAPIPKHFERWRIQDCYKSAHVGKVMPANWKACAEAFLESYHVLATHPQAAPFVSSEGGQYDVLSDHVTRFLSPTAVASVLAGTGLDERGRIEAMTTVGSRAGTGAQREVLDGITARQYVADQARELVASKTGIDFDQASDAEMIDGIAYDFFPSFHLWGGFAQKICYRFRPDGTNHERTLMEVMLFELAPQGQPKPTPAPYRLLGPEDDWALATELNYLSGIYGQDESNLGPVQEGLRALGDGDLQFSRYGDLRCRHLHRMIDRYLAA
ncbi:(2Fe-2S)-binding protein [Novosphingobium endophyticum]|uniref:(2Fe-2S)-binding protein n=2 Tax=Novosphingobium endophyticum TaxID=1955250 RepID=A0A916TS30_9SPHN|nr:(2Fe-2S)-binding protein [Novosphingobium endophyticum]